MWIITCGNSECSEGPNFVRMRDEGVRPTNGLAVADEVDHHLGFGFDSLAVEERGAVAPLLHGLGRRVG